MALLFFVGISAIGLAAITSDFRWRPAGLAIAFALRLSVPSFVGDIGVSGAIPALHISTIVILAYAVVWPLRRLTMEAEPDEKTCVPFLCHLCLTVVILGSIAMSGTISAMGAVTGFLLNQVVAPYIFCNFLCSLSRHSRTFPRDAARFFVLSSVATAAIAILIHYGLLRQPYLSSAASVIQSWLDVGRQSATLDHPLTLGLLLAVALPMTAYFRSPVAMYSAALTLSFGIFLSQSRIAFAGAALGWLYLLAIGARSLRGRLTAVAAIVSGYFLIESTGIAEGLITRIRDDTGSSQDRIRALELFTDNWTDFSVFGIGMDLNKLYFLENGLSSSGESAFICYVVGIGLPLTIIYFSIMGYLIYYGLRRSGCLSAAALSAIIAFASVQFFSSISTESAAGLILWTAIGLAISTAGAPSHSRKLSSATSELAQHEPSRHKTARAT